MRLTRESVGSFWERLNDPLAEGHHKAEVIVALLLPWIVCAPFILTGIVLMILGVFGGLVMILVTFAASVIVELIIIFVLYIEKCTS